MKTSTIIAILASLSTINVSAQSGRKPEPGASPTPAAAEKQVPEYSESGPQQKRTIYRRPARRNTVPVPNARKASENVPTVPGEDVERVETNLITIPVSVFDRNGVYVSGLQQQDFKIYEDGVEQNIEYFGTSEKPFTVLLLLDTSLSTEYRIEEIQQAAAAFVELLKPQDKVIVIEFDGNVNLLTDATGDRAKINKAIRKADFGFGTSLYDAVEQSFQKRLSKIPGRKAIVLFTDGVDTTSTKAGYDSTLALAEEADTLVFPVYYNTFNDNQQGGYRPLPDEIMDPRGTTAEEYALGKQYLEDLAAYTGGRVFRPEATQGGLMRAFEGVAEELRRQYSIGYIPKADAKPGDRKQIKVRVNRPNLAIRARDSYVVGSN